MSLLWRITTKLAAVLTMLAIAVAVAYFAWYIFPHIVEWTTPHSDHPPHTVE